VISTKEQEDIWAEERKYYAARFVWHRRSLLTPKRLTWEAWWERMFQDKYKDYVRKMMDKKKEA
jgi:hypothetical protein